MSCNDEKIIGTMDQVTINKQKLIEEIKNNKETHRQAFLLAQKGYKETVIEELENQLEDARAGAIGHVHFNMAAPQDQTKDYEVALGMLEMSEDEEIVISQRDFQCYVMDDWGWKQQWTTSNHAYVTKGASS